MDYKQEVLRAFLAMDEPRQEMFFVAMKEMSKKFPSAPRLSLVRNRVPNDLRKRANES